MTMNSAVQHNGTDAYPQLLDGLRVEFGCDDVDALGEAFLAAEEVDFHWNSRLFSRHLGQFFDRDDTDEEFDGVAIIGLLAGRWFVATCIVDGDGEAVDLLGKQVFASYREAATVFERTQ